MRMTYHKVLLASATVLWMVAMGCSSPSPVTPTPMPPTPILPTPTATPIVDSTPTPQEVTERFEAGMDLLESGQFQDSMAEFDFVIRFRSDFAEGYLGRGVALFQLNKPKEAIADFTKVIELDPGSAIAYRNRGVLKVREGDGKGGTDDLVKALNIYTEAGDEEGIADIHAIHVHDLGRVVELNDG